MDRHYHEGRFLGCVDVGEWELRLLETARDCVRWRLYYSAALMHLRNLWAGWLLLLICTVSSIAAALPVQYRERPIVLPKGVARFDGGPRWPDYDAQFKQVIHQGPNEFFVNPGFSYGVAKDLEVGGVVPVRGKPNLQLENPHAYLLYQLNPKDPGFAIFGELEIGIRSPFVLTLGVPALFKVGKIARIDLGGFMRMRFGGNGNTVDLVAPIYFPFQLTNRFFMGPETGIVHYQAFEPNSGVAIPAGGFLGYTVGSASHPLADLILRSRMLDVLNGLRPIEVMLAAEVYFDM